MDIQRTRTASETGTGRQFDTTQRHLITAVVDKTRVYNFAANRFPKDTTVVLIFECIFSSLTGRYWFPKSIYRVLILT